MSSRGSRTLPWIAIALAGPPEGLSLEDPGPWIDASEALLDGPPGCWEMVGRATWDHTFGPWGATRGDAVFAARLVDGVWGEIALFPLGMIERAWGERGEGPETYASVQRFTPLIGQVRGLAVSLDDEGLMNVKRSTDPRIDPVNTVRDVIDGLSPGSETAYVRWDEVAGAVALTRDRTVGKARSPLSSTVWFPDGGLAASTWRVHLTRPYHHDRLGLARVTALDVSLEVAPDGAPRAEQMSTELNLAGVRFSARQRLTYTSAVRCAVR